MFSTQSWKIGRMTGATMAGIFGSSTERLRRLVRVTKTLSTGAAALTLSFVVVLFGFQTLTWMTEGSWPDRSLSWLVTNLRFQDPVFTTASEAPPSHELAQFFWNVPTTALLLLVAALFGLFYLWLTHLEASLQGDRPDG